MRGFVCACVYVRANSARHFPCAKRKSVHDSPPVMVWDHRERKMGSEVNLRLVQFIRILKGCGGGGSGSRLEAGTRWRSAALTTRTRCEKVNFMCCMTKVDVLSWIIKGNWNNFLYSLHVSAEKSSARKINVNEFKCKTYILKNLGINIDFSKQLKHAFYYFMSQ